MKLRSIVAAAAVAASCGSAFALSPADTAAASTIKVYVSGATALRAVIGGLFTQNCAADLDVYFSGIGTYSGIAFAANGDAHRVYSCTMKATSPFLPGKKVALFKSDIGGSGQGVFPVFASTQRGFLAVNPTNCSGARVDNPAPNAPNYVCGTTETQQIPMAGVSDVEPALFKDLNVPKDDPSYPIEGLSDSQLSELTVKPLFQTVFAVAVSRNLRDEMQAKQGLVVGSEDEAQQPTMPRAVAASYFSGSLSSPAGGLGWQILVRPTDPNKDTQVNVCRRVDGSGTQAAANRFFAEFPCNTSSGVVADSSFSDAGLTNVLASVGRGGQYFVFEGSSTGNVTSCLTTAHGTAGGGAYAIGHVSRENAPGAANWRHVKLDGVSPGRDRAKAGEYDYLVESTMQWNTAFVDTLSADQKSFLEVFAEQAAKPDALASLSANAQNGVAALPTSYAGAFGVGTTNEIKFGSRVTRGGNSCSPLSVVK